MVTTCTSKHILCKSYQISVEYNICNLLQILIILFTLEWAAVFTDVKFGMLIYNTSQVISITLYMLHNYISTLY